MSRQVKKQGGKGSCLEKERHQEDHQVQDWSECQEKIKKKQGKERSEGEKKMRRKQQNKKQKGE